MQASVQGSAEHMSVPKDEVQSGAEKSAVPIFEVAFNNGMWWSIPQNMSQLIYEKYQNGENACYTWDSGESREGSWQPNAEMLINRYAIDFMTWEQRNLNNDKRRSVRLVWVAAESVVPKWTGQVPDAMESAETWSLPSNL